MSLLHLFGKAEAPRSLQGCRTVSRTIFFLLFAVMPTDKELQDLVKRFTFPLPGDGGGVENVETEGGRKPSPRSPTLETTDSVPDLERAVITHQSPMITDDRTEVTTATNRATVNFPEDRIRTARVGFASAELRNDFKIDASQRKEELDDASSTGTYSSKISLKRYKLFLLPKDIAQCSTVCGKLIGQGTTFCTNQNCTVAHRSGGGKMALVPSDIYVSTGTNNRAFVEPSVSAKLLDNDVIEAWRGDSQTLEDWGRQFRAATFSFTDLEADKKLSAKELKAEVEATFNLEKLKTPRKSNTQDLLEVSPMKNYSLLEDNDSLPKLKLDEITVKPFLNHLDKGILEINRDLGKLWESQLNSEGLLGSVATSVDLKLQEIKDNLGTKPPNFSDDFEAPTLWGVVGNVVEEVKELPKTFDSKLLMMSKKADDLLKINRQEAQDDLVRYVTPLQEKVNGLFTALKDIGDNVSGELGRQANRINWLSQQQNIRQPPAVDHQREIDKLNEQIQGLTLSITELRADQAESIKFADLGFRSYQEAASWSERFNPDDSFGFLVDFHIVMENVQRQINGVDGLKTMNDLYKLKFMTTNAEAVAITSFSNAIPRFFSEAGAHKVLTDAASYFSEIKSYEQWKDPINGFKTRWKRELEDFRKSHSNFIIDAFQLTDKMKALAAQSLNVTISWCLSFIDYLGETYEEYAAGKFGPKKAWHVTTRLGLSLIREIAKPRSGTINSFTAGDQRKVSTHVFWAALRSLDKMSEVLSFQFRNHPVVSTELVKFLSLNTSVEAVNKLTAQHITFQTELKDLKKEVKEAKGNSSTNGNKVTEFGPKISALIKRVDKVEAKIA